MKNATQLAMKHESFLSLEDPLSDNLPHGLQSTIWLDEQGYIQDSDGPVEQMFGYWFQELRGLHISLLLPDLGHTDLLTQNRINPILLFRCHCSIPLRGVDSNGHEHKYIVLINLLSNQLGQRLSMTIRDHVP
jgi:PAS domain-containing protein